MTDQKSKTTKTPETDKMSKYPLPKVYTKENPETEELRMYMKCSNYNGIPGPLYEGWVPLSVYKRIQENRK
jgi:hypothetical protein